MENKKKVAWRSEKGQDPNMKQQTGQTRAVTILKAVFLLLFFTSLFFYVSYNLYDHSYGFASEEPLSLEDWTVVMPDGSSFQVQEPYEKDPAYGIPYRLMTRLPEKMSQDYELCFLYFNDLVVKVDDEVRTEFVRQRDVNLVGGIVKATYLMLTIPKEDAGKMLELTRERSNTERRIYPRVLLGPPDTIYRFMIDEYGAVFAMYLVLLAISALIVIAGIVLSIWLKTPIDMLYAGFSALITTAWMISDSFLYPLVFRHNFIDGTVSYLLCMLIPLPFLIYMNALQRNRHEKWYLRLQVFSVASFLIFSTLHFSGICPFYNTLPLVDTVLALDILACIVILTIDIVHGHIAEFKYTAIGFLGFFILALMQIIVIFTMDLNNDGILLLLGLLFWLACVVIQQLQEIREADLEKKRAMELSDAKTRFLAGMSHEIRTPINSILGMNEMILRENHDDTIGGYAKEVQNAGKMLLALINDVLDFSKIESGKLDITPADYDLGSLLFQVVSLVKERAGAKGLDFDLQIAEGIPRVLYGDDVRIKQILLNLLTNAVKYTDRGKVVLCVSGEPGDENTCRLCFEVRDTGKGIREEEQKTLFDAFSRADLSRNRSVEGTGLGLAIVKRIVDSMDGSISVESKYGEGSVFRVILPQPVRSSEPLSLELKPEETPSHAYRSAFTAPGAKILAVDDNAANLSIVRQFLKQTQVTIDCCMNGNEAFAACCKVKYDLILLDHMMPDPDGIATLAKIRNSELSLNKDTSAIVLTANALAGSRQLYIDAGFADYLTKPIASAVLEETVKTYLPKELVIETGPDIEAGQAAETEPAIEQNASKEGRVTSMDAGFSGEKNNKWAGIKEIDFDAAVEYCGGEEVLELVIDEIIKDHGPRLKRMEKALNEKDYDTYRIEAHAIKSNLATIGANEMSERARQHEYAVKDNNIDFVLQDHEAFMNGYADLCKRMEQVLKGTV